MWYDGGMKDIFLLDLDDTLLDFGQAERANLTYSLAACGVEADDALIRLFHVINDALWKALERGELTRERLLALRFERLREASGLTFDAAAVADAYFNNFSRFCFPYPGSLEFLKQLSLRGRAYLVTNGSAAIQHAHVRDAGFAPYFTKLFISEEMGVYKPSKEYAEAVVCGIENFSKDRAILLGDSLTSDMGCANAMGVDFVLYRHESVPEGYGGVSVQSYSEFLRLL